MSSLNALNVAVEAATRKRDAARQVLQDMQRVAQAGQAQLEQLSGYAQETQGRWGMREGGTVQPEVMYHHYQFIGKLEHAIGLQSGVVQEQARRVEQARQAFPQRHLAQGHRVGEHGVEAIAAGLELVVTGDMRLLGGMQGWPGAQ